MKTSELTDAALDFMVAKAEGKFMVLDPMGFGARSANGGYWIWDENMQIGNHYSPSSLWSQGGPIIERERIDCISDPNGTSGWLGRNWVAGKEVRMFGPTPLVATMRVYVASKLGLEVKVPDDLLDDTRVA